MDGVGHRKVRIVASDHPSVLRLDEHAAVDELADELLEEERVPVGAIHEQVAQLFRQLRELFLEQLRDCVDGQWVEPEDGRVALAGSPRRPDLENLRPRRRDEHHGRAHVGHEPLEEVEEIGLGPVDVLDDEDEWRAGGELLDEAHGRGV
jgi:hypothetical protein